MTQSHSTRTTPHGLICCFQGGKIGEGVEMRSEISHGLRKVNFFLVLGIELMALSFPGKRYPAQPYPWPEKLTFILIFPFPLC